MYKCDKCSKIFTQKYNLNRHQNRLKPCIQNCAKIAPKNTIKKVKDGQQIQANMHQQFENVLQTDKKVNKGQQSKNITTHVKVNNDQQNSNINIISNLNNHVCKYCEKTFSSGYCLRRHTENRCKIKKLLNTEREDIFKMLMQKVKDLEQSNKKLIEENKHMQKKMKKMTIKNIYATVNVNNNNLTYNNNTKLVAFGKEDKNKLPLQEIINAVQGYGTEVELTKLIHFNDKYPENHNVYINNRKDNYAMTFDGEQWILKSKTSVIEDIYDANIDLVDDKMKDFVKVLDDSQLRSLLRWRNTQEDDDKIKKIKDDIKLLLYNKKDMVVKQLAKPDIPTITVQSEALKR